MTAHISLTSSPLVAFIDPNMIEPNGLIPSAMQFLRGLRIAPIAPGDVIHATDEDGEMYSAVIERVERGLIYLRVTPLSRKQSIQTYAFTPILAMPTPDQDARRSVHIEPNPWVLVP
jgi:hypothetical protein